MIWQAFTLPVQLKWDYTKLIIETVNANKILPKPVGIIFEDFSLRFANENTS